MRGHWQLIHVYTLKMYRRAGEICSTNTHTLIRTCNNYIDTHSKHPSACTYFLFITRRWHYTEIYVSSAHRNWRFFKMLIRYKKSFRKLHGIVSLWVAHNSGSKHIKAAVEIWYVMRVCIPIYLFEWSMFRAWPKHILASPTSKSLHGTELRECDAVPGWWMQQTFKLDTLVCHN